MTKTLPDGPIWDAAKTEGNWFVYRITPADESGKIGKVPCNSDGFNTGTARAARLTFREAVKTQQFLKTRIGAINSDIDEENARRMGTDLDHMQMAIDFTVGYLPRPGSAMVVLDFDHVIEDGELADWVPVGESYTEVSASGSGLHVLTPRLGGDAGVRERNQAGLYAGVSRGISLTFNLLEDSPRQIAPAPRARAVVEQRAGRERPGTNGGSLRLPEEMHDLDAIPELLAQLPNPGADYDWWVRFAHALKAAANEADGETALAIESAFHEWSDRMPGAATDSSERLWKSIRNTRDITSGTFYFMAGELGWSPRSAAHPPPVRRDFDKWLKRAASGDEEALQRIVRFLLRGLKDDVMRVLTASLARLSGVEPGKAEAIFNHEMRKYEYLITDTLAGVTDLQVRQAVRGTSKEIARRIETLVNALPTEHLEEIESYIRSVRARRR